MFADETFSVIPVLMTCVENQPTSGIVISLITFIFRTSPCGLHGRLEADTSWLTVAELGPNQTILPSDKKERALCHQWQCFADQEVGSTRR